MNHSKKKRIIAAIEHMDIGMLDLLLNEESTYQDARKEVFLNKLNKVFFNLKKDKDTSLVARIGVCKSTECPNTGCSGYAFVGNNSANYLSLVFKEEEDDYSDIFNCNVFNADSYDLEKEGEWRHRPLLLDQDEMANFVPGVDYLITSQKCKNAYEEIMEFSKTLLTKEIYTVWIAKYHYLYDSLDNLFDIPAAYKQFVYLYSSLYRFAKLIPLEAQAQEALTKIQNIDTSLESNLIPWVLEYEELRNELMELEYEFKELKETGEKYFVCRGLHIDSSEYQLFHTFIKDYNILHDRLWKKYYVMRTDEEQTEDGLQGLAWHIENAKQMK